MAPQGAIDPHSAWRTREFELKLNRSRTGEGRRGAMRASDWRRNGTIKLACVA
jgi:hypothetical protein